MTGVRGGKRWVGGGAGGGGARAMGAGLRRPDERGGSNRQVEWGGVGVLGGLLWGMMVGGGEGGGY